MIKHENIKEVIEDRLPAELVEFLRLSGRTAAHMGQRLYLVGGVVRDLLLERSNTDLDLVIEGDAIDFAMELARILNAKVIAHSHFRTAKIKLERWTVDIATARTEFYSQPGELPTVQSKTDILGDLQTPGFYYQFDGRSPGRGKLWPNHRYIRGKKRSGRWDNQDLAQKQFSR